MQKKHTCYYDTAVNVCRPINRSPSEQPLQVKDQTVVMEI